MKIFIAHNMMQKMTMSHWLKKLKLIVMLIWIQFVVVHRWQFCSLKSSLISIFGFFSFTILSLKIDIMTLLPPKDLQNLIFTAKSVYPRKNPPCFVSIPWNMINWMRYNYFVEAKEGSREDIRLKFLNGQQPIPT